MTPRYESDVQFSHLSSTELCALSLSRSLLFYLIISLFEHKGVSPTWELHTEKFWKRSKWSGDGKKNLFLLMRCMPVEIFSLGARCSNADSLLLNRTLEPQKFEERSSFIPPLVATSHSLFISSVFAILLRAFSLLRMSGAANRAVRAGIRESNGTGSVAAPVPRNDNLATLPSLQSSVFEI